MKNITIAFAVLLLANLLLPNFSHDNQLFAVSGCCKVRGDDGEDWQRTNKSFNSCKMLNEEEDRDNIFEDNGFVWWDVTCR